MSPPPILSREEVLAALADILRAPEFSRSESLSRLLDYLVRHALDGRADDLKEYSLGVQVFERGREFDPRIDNIVRVQARKLRQRLTNYYAEPRSGVRIELVKGSYIPSFTPIGSEQQPLEQSTDGSEAGTQARDGSALERGEGAPQLQFQAESSLPRRFAGTRLPFPWRYVLTALVAASVGCVGGFVYGERKMSLEAPDLNNLTYLQMPSVVLATGSPGESRLGGLLIQALRTRLGEVPDLRITQKPSRRDFRTGAVIAISDNRVSMRLAALGGPGFHRSSERCSVLVEDDLTNEETSFEVLIDRFLTDLKIVAEDTETVPFIPISDNGSSAAREFTTSSLAMTNGTWSYGWELQTNGPFHPYQTPFRVKYWGVDVIGWSMSGEGPENGAKCCPFVAKNTSDYDIKEPGVNVPRGQLWFHPGPKGERSVVRWTSNATGRYSIQARFTGLSDASSDVHIARNGVSLFDDAVDSQGAFHDVIISDFMCLPEHTLDFVVGWGTDRDYNNDITGLDVSIASTRTSTRH